jgi:hypothetical protein
VKGSPGTKNKRWKKILWEFCIEHLTSKIQQSADWKVKGPRLDWVPNKKNLKSCGLKTVWDNQVQIN